jgi:hypothetical protein
MIPLDLEYKCVFTLRSCKLRPRFFKQISLFFGVETLSSEHWNEVFVPKFLWTTIFFVVVRKLLCSLRIHIIGIPGGVWSTRRHGINSQMGVDVEF